MLRRLIELREWRKMSAGDRWLVAISMIALLLPVFLFWLRVVATDMDPRKFRYAHQRAGGSVKVLPYKGVMTLALFDESGRRLGDTACTPYGREYGCVTLAMQRGLRTGDRVSLDLLTVRGWPLASDVIVGMRSERGALLGCRERLQALGVALDRIDNPDALVRC